MLKYEAADSFSPWVEGSDKNANVLCWAERVAEGRGLPEPKACGRDGGQPGRTADPQGEWGLGVNL